MEMMEMKTELDSLNPNGHLLYVHHGDFVESIRDIKAKQNTTQVNLINGKKYFPELSSSKLKDLLYNFKLIILSVYSFPIPPLIDLGSFIFPT